MYYCQLPDCEYQTEEKSQIHFHHIIPKSMGGSNKKNNLLSVCPTCHSKIFVQGMSKGPHSIECKNSIIINKKVLTTAGLAIEYKYLCEEGFNYSLIKE
jgi:DNA-directed RNA polymerase subunit RPC12/RpoP